MTGEEGPTPGAGGSKAPEGQDGPTLRRGLGLPLLTLYGLGTIIGAGIYVLIGKVAGSAGIYAPISFLLASLLAAFTVFSFAELSSRFPKSAGEALYVYKASGRRLLALAVGLLVVLAGIVSAASISLGSVGYFNEFWQVPGWLAVSALVVLLGTIAAWGITQSVALAAFATILEVVGLLLVIWGGRAQLASLPGDISTMLPPLDWPVWSGVLTGSVLAFYAFIGFEDMVNVAEEVKDPRRTLPRAILLTLVLATLLYMAVVTIAVRVLPPETLAESAAPLSLIFQQTGAISPDLISAIALVAVLNGALVQIIMAARVLYGLSRQGWLPGPFGQVHPRRRTPLKATLLVSGLVLAFALWLPLVTLATVTSFVALVIFSTVNLALLLIKRSHPLPEGAVSYPAWIPAIGFVASAAFALLALWHLV